MTAEIDAEQFMAEVDAILKAWFPGRDRKTAVVTITNLHSRALAEARRQIAERAEALKTSSGLLREMRDLVKDHPDFQRRDLVPLGIAVNSALNAAALLSEPAGAKEEEGSDAA